MKFKNIILNLAALLILQTSSAQSVEIQGEAKVTEMTNDNKIDEIVVRKPDGTLATRSAQSLPSSFQDTIRTLNTDLELAKFICECGSDLPPYMIESLKAAGYSNQDLIKAGVPVTNIIALDQTVMDIDGNQYDIVTIGTQKWMKQNLRVTKFNDGTSIPLVTDTDGWADSIEEEALMYTYPNGDINNVPTHGLLYSGYTSIALFNSGKNVCPVGWRVPSRADFDDLREIIEPGSISNNNSVGKYLKKTGTVEWDAPNIGANNLTEFDGIPAGKRNSLGAYSLFSTVAFYNTTHVALSTGTYPNTLVNNTTIFDDSLTLIKEAGNSIRCLKD